MERYIPINAQPFLPSYSAVLPWGFVAGALLHLIVPAWLVVLAVSYVADSPAGQTQAALLAWAITLSVRFIAAFTVFTIVAALLARALDPWLRARRDRRAAGDPEVAARASAARLDAALAEVAAALPGVPPADMIRAACLDHGETAVQRFTADLAETVAAFGRALATASPTRRPALAAEAAVTLADLAGAAQALAAERGTLDEGDARAVAGYVRARYSQDAALEFTGSHSA